MDGRRDARRDRGGRLRRHRQRGVSADNVRDAGRASCARWGWHRARTAPSPRSSAPTRCSVCGSRSLVTDPERTRRLTTPFAALFNPVLVALVVAAFVWICWWVLFEQAGWPRATHEAFARPGLLLAVLAITVLSAGFHEFGHAAAARRGGATARRHGGRALPGLAGVLHRRHRLLPARPRRTAAHRPRWPLLQRDRRRRHRRRLVGHPGTTRPAARRGRRSCRCCASCCRWCASTATTCSPTSPGSRTSSSGSGRRCAGLLPVALAAARRRRCSSRGLGPW